MLCDKCFLEMERFDAKEQYNHLTKKYDVVILYFCPACGKVKAKKKVKGSM